MAQSDSYDTNPPAPAAAPADALEVAMLIARATDRIAGLQAVTEAFSDSLTPVQVAEVVVEQGVRALGARAGSVALLTEDRQELELVRAVGYPEESVEPFRRFPVNAAIPLADAVRTGEPIFLEGWAQWQARYPREDETARAQGDTAWAAVPLVIEGRALGGIGLSFSGLRTFNDDDKSFMNALARQCAQALERARLYAEADRARKAAEVSGRRMAFLATASAALATSLDYQTTLSQVAALLVPEMADWCALDMVGVDGSVERLAVAHADPARVAWAVEIQRRYPPAPDAPSGVYSVLRTGRSEFYPEITEEMLVGAARDAEHLTLLREIDFASAMLVPLTARGSTLGVLTLVTTHETGRQFGPKDLAFAEDLAWRAALSVDNARLYQKAQSELAERAQVEEALRAEEENFRLLFASNPHPMWVFDRRTLRFLEVNAVAVARYGYSREEFLSLTIADIRPPEDVPRLWDDVRQNRQGADFAGRWQHRLKSGQIIDVEVVSHHIGYEGREAALVVAQDITARSRAEAERERAEAALRESEQRFRQVADSAPVMIWMSGTDGVCDYFNKSWLDFTGRSTEQEADDGWTAGIHPDDLASYLEIYNRSFQAREPFDLEYRLRRHDGEYRWIMDIGTPRFQADRDATFLGYIGSCIDVTERRLTEQAALENEAKQRTFLREVLSSVTEGKLRLCDSPADLPPSLPPAGAEIVLSRQNLHTLRREARAAAQSRSLCTARTQDLETAVGEAAMNAVTHAGGGTGRVCAGDDGTVQVWVEDRGAGIDMRRLPRATLERGYTTAGSLGHGFWLMLQTVDEIWLLTGSKGTTVVLEQHRTVPEPAWLDPPL